MRRLREQIDRDVAVKSAQIDLPGLLRIPQESQGIVVFAHGSGSSRLSPRNLAVAHHLNKAGLGTLVFDLLTEPEASDRSNVFDIELLASRLEIATRWLHGELAGADYRIGYFGASTGAAAALVAAANLGCDVSAVVSRGGRPDLAGESLCRVSAPTLLIVGGRDRQVLDLNREAQARLECPNELVVVPGATHLFEEAGAIEDVSDLACRWFVSHLAQAAGQAG